MDNYRGHFADHSASEYIEPDYASDEDDMAVQQPPLAIGQNERRMQVRAYNHWAGLLGNRSFPSIVDLQSAPLPDFAPHAVLLDFSKGIDNPGITMLGEKLADECGTDKNIRRLSDVPGRSLLSRITDHYMQILANQTPIGFEAEFVNQLGKTILYRGILLPYSDDGRTIQHIMGVINWKEMADQQTTDALLKEIDQALENNKYSGWDQAREDDVPEAMQPLELTTPLPNLSPHGSLPEWADGPAAMSESDSGSDSDGDDGILDLTDFVDLSDGDDFWSEPPEGITASISEAAFASPLLVKKSAHDTATEIKAPTPAKIPDKIPDNTMALTDWLASARELAVAALGSEDRTRHALYAAIGRAHDFALAAGESPQEFQEMVSEAGLTVQDRAPFTPIVKLVFGANYDKTRLTEYGAALSYARRLGLGRSALANHLIHAPGGLKGVVGEERKARRSETGKPAIKRQNLRESMARKLRQLTPQAWSELQDQGHEKQGEEFSVILTRRLASGELVVLGEVAQDLLLLERAARHIIG